ncbi:hypothetical protein JOC85_002549 [Bacillus mesophilus]|uniref:Carboxypeptidase regulatory-like domain-containing protein n=1 Tax=Bacillus mesophilus TaxID=1808955 RepID=A0A6M0Q7V4_9BACI|nr:carboxypeptidase-like regulatory domain-containing protein [Bacillus mesophilus]MBM7661746.1 hypothetical protein [Bacillus mesophilus]NEY72404.1 carboxypeptidase regulatory-like domain-containing protein [Bacillus mesophilus]
MVKRILYSFLLVVFLVSSFVVEIQANTTSVPSVNAEKSQKDIQGKMKGLEGTVKEGIHPIKNSQLWIQAKGETKFFNVTTNSKGKFETNIPDGVYTVKAIHQNKSWFNTNEAFNVKNGKLSNDEIQITEKKKIKESTKKTESNLLGVLKEGDKGIKGELILSRYTSEYDEEVFFVSSKNNGKFSAFLPDGNYLLFGVNVDGGSYHQQMYFKVENGELYIDEQKQSTLMITLPEKVYNGSITSSESSLVEASVILEKVINEEEYNYEFIEFVATNKKGQFSFRKLADGTYSISVYHPTYSSWQVLKFDVVNGLLYIDGSEVATFDIKVPEITLQGQLLEGKNAITEGYIDIEGHTTDGEFTGFFNTNVDSKGNFEYRLSDGLYRITSIYEQNRQTNVNLSFEIQNGKLIQDGVESAGLVINLPPVTFKGKLLDQGISLQGSVYVEKVNEDGSTEWFNASTDETGVYSLRLTDGEYRLVGAYLYEGNEEIGFSTLFAILDGELYVDGNKQELLELQIPPVSFYGKVLDGEHPVTGGQVSFTTLDEGQYYWKQISEDGSVSMRFADGEYKVKYVDLFDGTSTELNLAFTIQNGKLYVNGEEKVSLDIVIPAVTLSGVLLDAGVPVTGSINLYSISDPNQTYYYGHANEDGTFQFRLPDGEYVLDAIYFNDGTSFIPSINFSIVSGELVVNGETKQSLEITIPPLTLTGTVFDRGQVVSSGNVNVMEIGGSYSWFSSWIHEDGTYGLRLPDGVYELYSVDTPDTGSVYFHKGFTISEGKLFVDGVELGRLDLFLEEGTIN